MSTKTFTLTINIKPFVEGLKGAITLSDKASQEIKAALSGNAKVNTSQFDAAYKEITSKMQKVAKEKFNVDVDIDAEKAINSLRQTQSQVQNTSSAFTKFRDNLANIGFAVQGAISTFNAMNRVIGGVISPFKNFEQAMSTLEAISGATEIEMGNLSEQAKELGRTTMFTATQVGELQIEFSKLGFTAVEIEKVTEGTLALAAATGSTLADAAAVAGATLRGFSMQAGETNRVTDVMSLSFSRSALDLSKFRESMKTIAPVAAAANFNIEETTALLAKMADAGISGSMAGFGLKNILSDLFDESSNLNKLFGNQVKNFDDFVMKLQELKEGNFDLVEATKYLDERSKAAFLTLVNGSDDLAELKGEFDNAQGSAKKMADVMMDNLKGASLEFQSAVEGLAIAFVEKFAPALKVIVDSGTKLIGIFTKLADFMPTIIVGAIGISMALTTANTTIIATNVALGIQTGIIATLISGWETLQIAIMLNPFGFAAAAIAIAVTALYSYTDHLRKVNDEFEILKTKADEIKEVLEIDVSTKAIDEYNEKFGTQIKTIEEVREELDKYRLWFIEPLPDNVNPQTYIHPHKEKVKVLEHIIELLEEEQAATDRAAKASKEAANAEYYKELKFLAADYYEYSVNELEKEKQSRIASGAWTKEQAQEAYEHKVKLLDQEKQAFDDILEEETKLAETQARELKTLMDQIHLSAIEDEYEKKEKQLSIARETALEKAKLLKASDDELLQIEAAYASMKVNLRSENNKKEAEETDKLQQEELRIIETFNSLYAKSDYDRMQNKLAQMDAYYLQNREKLLAAGVSESEIVEAIESKKAEIRANYAQQNVDKVSGFLGQTAEAMKAFGKRGFLAWKRSSQMQAIVDTYSSANAAYKAMAGIPVVGPLLGAAAAAAAVISGMVNVKKIEAQKYALGGPIEGGEQLIRVNEKGKEFIFNDLATSVFGVPVLNYMNKFPEKAKSLIVGLPKLPSVPSLQPQYAFSSGGSTSGAGISFTKLEEKIEKLEKSLVNAIQAMNINMVNRTGETPVNIIVETSDPEIRIRRDQKIKNRIIKNNGSFDE